MCRYLECVSVTTHDCAHGTTVLTNPESPELFGCRVYLLGPPGNDTDHNKKIHHLKNSLYTPDVIIMGQ